MYKSCEASWGIFPIFSFLSVPYLSLSALYSSRPALPRLFFAVLEVAMDAGDGIRSCVVNPIPDLPSGVE